MNKKWLYLIPIFLIGFNARAWKLLVIQSVEESGRSFTTRTAPGMDKLLGQEGTFTVNDASVVVKATQIDDELTRWLIKNSHTAAPFVAGELVTFHPSPEVVWLGNAPEQKQSLNMVATDEELINYPAFVKSKEDLVPAIMLLRGLQFRLHQGFGIHESVSKVASSVSGTRLQRQVELYYFQEFFAGVRGNFGLRIDRESSELKDFTIFSSRQYAILGIDFYLNKLLPFFSMTPYMGASLGLGSSESKVGGFRQSGTSFILPHVRMGVDITYFDNWSINIEWGVEAIYNREKIEVAQGPNQKITQTNGKLGLGLCYAF